MDDLLVKLSSNSLISLNFNKIGRKKLVQKKAHDYGGSDTFATVVDHGGARYNYTESIHVSLQAGYNPSMCSAESNVSPATTAIISSTPPSSEDLHFGRSSVFRSLIHALYANTSLLSLSLGHNNLDAQAGALIAQLLRVNHSITTLSLSFNKLGPDGCRSICEALTPTAQKHSSITSLDIGSNAILNEGAQHLADMLLLNQTLLVLDVTNSNIYVDGSQALIRALCINKTLRQLHFSKNYILTDGCQMLKEMLATNRSLTRFDITHNYLYSGGMEKLGAGIALNRHLLELHVATNEIEDGLKDLCSGLRSNSVLQTLLIHDNLIPAESFSHLYEALKKNTSLTLLHLCDNPITAKGAEYLAKLIKVNKGLLRLHIASCEINAEGMKALAKTFRCNTTLLELNASWNRFGAEGARYIGEILSTNTSLKELHISHNKMMDEGCVFIAEGLKANQSLLHLDISSNRIRMKGIEAIAAQLQSNHTLLYLNYDQQQPAVSASNLFPPQADQLLEFVLRRNMRESVSDCKLAMMMAFHPKLGSQSPLAQVFGASDIADKSTLRLVWDMLWPANHLSTASISSPPTPLGIYPANSDMAQTQMMHEFKRMHVHP